MAKPVVTTDAGSVSQYIEMGVSGFVVPVRDVKQLVSCVSPLIRDEKLRVSVGKAAREVAMHSLSIDSAAMRTDRIYRSITKNLQMS